MWTFSFLLTDTDSVFEVFPSLVTTQFTSSKADFKPTSCVSPLSHFVSVLSDKTLKLVL